MHEGDFLVERYRLVRSLGKGAMGQVWLAHDTLLSRHVAIKHLLATSQESLNDEFVQRAMREARLAAQLNHPNAVQIFDLIVSDGVPHVVMEYVEGETLANRLAAAGRMPPHAIRPVIRQIATGLAAAHELGIVHRDVKPANILIATNGVAKLADFGIARTSQDPNLTSTGLVVGTLAFMAPEVATGDPATPASDVWSLGATAYAATEGRAPFAGESSARMLYRKVSEPPPLPTGAGELTALVQAMMAPEPAGRPIARDVARALEGSGPPSWAGAAPSAQAEPTRARNVGPGFERTVLRDAHEDPATVRTGPDQYPRTDTRPAEQRRGRGGLIAALIVLALAIVGGAVAIVLATRPGNTPVAGTTHSASAPGPPPGTVTVTTDRSLAPTTPPPTVPATTPAPVQVSTAPVSTSGTLTYIGPAGLSAVGPASWDNSCPGATAPYQWCAGPEGFSGGYFRLRQLDSASLSADVQTEKHFFHTTYRDTATVRESPVTGWPLSSDAVDLIYTFNNPQGLPRKGIERVFVADGSGYLIATTDVPASWSRTQRVFHQLVDSAHA